MTIPTTPETTPASYQQNTSGSKNASVIVVAVIVLLAALLAAFAIFRTTHADSPSPTPTTSEPAPTDTSIDLTTYEGGGLSLGKELTAGTKNEGATQVDIYFDYACSHCNHLSNDYGAGLGEAAKAGDITLVYHPVAIMGVLFSYTGAGAEFFVADNEPDKYFAFHELLHEKIMTPYMNGDVQDPRAKDIVAIAKEAGVSEENCEVLSKELTEMENILLANDHSRSTTLLDHVIETTNLFIDNSQKAHGSAGTPTVYIDGKKAENWTTDIPELLDK